MENQVQQALESLQEKARVIGYILHRYNIDAFFISTLYGDAIDTVPTVTALLNETPESLQRFKNLPKWFEQTHRELDQAAMEILQYIYTYKL